MLNEFEKKKYIFKGQCANGHVCVPYFYTA